MLTLIVIQLVVGTQHFDLFTIQLDDEVIVHVALEEGFVQRDVIIPRLVRE